MSATPVVLEPCQITPSLLVPAPACEPQTIGRLYAAHAPLPMPAHGAGGGVEWEPDDCDYLVRSVCPACTFPGDPRSFDGLPELRNARPRALYATAECSGPGWPAEELQARARKRLEDGEEWAVEAELIASLRNPDTDDLGSAPSLTAAIARIGSWASSIRCLPTLHVPRGLLNVLGAAQLLAPIDGDEVRLHDGTRVVAGAGYDNASATGVPATPDQFFLYVSGRPVVYRGTIHEPSQESAVQVNLSQNDRSAIAELPVLVGHECGSAVVSVELG